MNIRPRILGACCIGIALVSGALLFTSRQGAFTASVQETEEATAVVVQPRKFIEIRDTNSDGVPDWQESLTSTTYLNIATSTEDSYTPPETFTGQFGVNFLETYLESKLYGTSAHTADDLVRQAGNEFQAQANDILFTQSDIVVLNESNMHVFRTYGNTLAEIAITNGSGSSRSEIAILRDAIDQNDEAILDELIPISTAYKKIVAQMRTVPVPEFFIKEHLDFLNAYNALFIDIQGMQKGFSDPLYTMARVKRYEDDTVGLYNALTNLYLKLDTVGIVWTEQDTTSKFIRIDTL